MRNFCEYVKTHSYYIHKLPGQNKMSNKHERIQGGNEMVISTVLRPLFVLCFGHFILFSYYITEQINDRTFRQKSLNVLLNILIKCNLQNQLCYERSSRSPRLWPTNKWGSLELRKSLWEEE